MTTFATSSSGGVGFWCTRLHPNPTTRPPSPSEIHHKRYDYSTRRTIQYRTCNQSRDHWVLSLPRDLGPIPAAHTVRSTRRHETPLPLGGCFTVRVHALVRRSTRSDYIHLYNTHFCTVRYEYSTLPVYMRGFSSRCRTVLQSITARDTYLS